jgi:hypothetical protein
VSSAFATELNNTADMEMSFESERLPPMVVCQADSNGNLDSVHRVPNPTDGFPRPAGLPSLRFHDGNWYSVRQSPEQREIDDDVRRLVRLRDAGNAANELRRVQGLHAMRETDMLQDALRDVWEADLCPECLDVEARNAARPGINSFWREWFHFLDYMSDTKVVLNPDILGDDPAPAEVCHRCSLPRGELAPRLPERFFRPPLQRNSLMHFVRFDLRRMHLSRKRARRAREVVKELEELQKASKEKTM